MKVTAQQLAQTLASLVLSEQYEVAEVVDRFEGFLAKHHLTALRSSVARHLGALALEAASKEDGLAEVISAIALSEDQAKALGATPETTTVDGEALMAGVVVTQGGKRVDASLAGKLARLEQALAQ